MKELRYPVITISRQYAAYGRTVARGLSQKLGIPFYDRDVVRKTAAESGFSEDDINREGENLSRAGKFMNDLLNNAASYPSSHDRIFEAQKAVVLELAKSPCIIVGRCADHILTEAGIPAYKVFLYADEAHRISRAAELEENRGLDPRKAAAKK
ncbi:MAG: cytidylate kinase-like family protein, partial [Eubacterium sp.]|nr:cytidylate kinase-like family protein [Eubacterium sp.]